MKRPIRSDKRAMAEEIVDSLNPSYGVQSGLRRNVVALLAGSLSLEGLYGLKVLVETRRCRECERKRSKDFLGDD